MTDYDAIVVGAGHNGLVCAYYLASHGLRVGVFESSDAIGGACKTEELIPGYRFSTCANWVGWWRSKVIDDLGLLDRDLRVGGADVPTRVLPDGSGFVFWPDADGLRSEIRKHAPQDVDAWQAWTDQWTGISQELGPWLLSYPPTGPNPDIGPLFNQLKGKSIADLVDQRFSSDAMRNAIAAPHDVGSLYESGSAELLALHETMLRYSETGSPVASGFVHGGMGEVSRAIGDAARDAGVDIYTSRAVSEVRAAAGAVDGIVLCSGEHISARRVILGCDPLTSARLLGNSLDRQFTNSIRSLRRIVAPLKLHCAMRRLPSLLAFPDSDLPYRGPLSLCRTREQSETAWLTATEGELPSDPYMVVMVPSVWDNSVSPAGCHTLSVWALYAPVSPNVGTWDTRRAEMLEKMLSALERDAPDFRECLLEAVLLTPGDLESRVGLPGGNIHHIDLSPGQILGNRPVPSLARYRFPIRGVYGCGASHHPYGEVSGAPGHNAAHAVLEDDGLVDDSWQQNTQTS